MNLKKLLNWEKLFPKKKSPDKPKIGIFSFTCCEGCVMSFLEVLNSKFFEYKEKMQIEYCRQLRPVKKLEPMDIAFIEGAISTKNDIKRLKEIRKNTKKLVALGSGAITGWPSDLRNKFDSKKKKEISPLIKKLKQIEKISPIKNFVKVDDTIPGCPVDEKLFMKKIDGYLEEFYNA